MDHRPSVELLESTHFFPGVYKIKAIGRADLVISNRGWLPPFALTWPPARTWITRSGPRRAAGTSR